MFIVFVIIVSAVIKAMHSADITIKNSKKLYVDLHRHLTGSLGFNTFRTATSCNKYGISQLALEAAVALSLCGKKKNTQHTVRRHPNRVKTFCGTCACTHVMQLWSYVARAYRSKWIN